MNPLAFLQGLGPTGWLSLFERGGPMLWVILVALLLGWTLIIERSLFLGWIYPRRRRRWLEAARQGPGPDSWSGQRYREALVSQAGQQLRRGLPMLRTLVILCPLLGLLGTVIGMLRLFEAIAVFGSGDVRALADGVAQATLSTLAGMVAALSLVYFPVNLEQRARVAQQALAETLRRG